MGHDAKMALRHYAQVTESHFEAAVTGKSVTQNLTHSVQQNVTLQEYEDDCTNMQMEQNEREIKGEMQLLAKSCNCLQNDLAEGVGFEPTDAFRHLRFSRPVH